MILIMNPYQTLIKLLEGYLAKKGITFEKDIGKKQLKNKKDCNYKKSCDEKLYLVNRANYTVQQGTKCRYLELGNLSDLGLQGLVACTLIRESSSPINNNKKLFPELDKFDVPNINYLTDEDIFGKPIADDIKLLSEYQMTYYKGRVTRYEVKAS